MNTGTKACITWTVIWNWRGQGPDDANNKHSKTGSVDYNNQNYNVPTLLY